MNIGSAQRLDEIAKLEPGMCVGVISGPLCDQIGLVGALRAAFHPFCAIALVLLLLSFLPQLLRCRSASASDLCVIGTGGGSGAHF
jgi:hypothetical protein